MVLIKTTIASTFMEAAGVYVCICNNVTERDIEDAVRGGARTLDCLSERLAVSTCCGQCRCYAEESLEAALHALSGTAEHGAYALAS
jgi:bacterioferritin-associated ferredoxin